MPKHNPKQIIKACRLCFQGEKDKKIANKLQIHPATLTKWRKLELWQKTEAQLIETTIQAQAEKVLKDA